MAGDECARAVGMVASMEKAENGKSKSLIEL